MNVCLYRVDLYTTVYNDNRCNLKSYYLDTSDCVPVSIKNNIT